jgi:uncharacterized protein (TIGR02996 family)
MFAVFVSHFDAPRPRRFAYPGQEITIGAVDGNHLILAEDGIEKHHARVALVDGELIVFDLGTGRGTYVNGRRLTSPLIVGEADAVQIGGYTLAFQHIAIDSLAAHAPYVAADPTEEAMLHAIANRDETIRSVYADWLEQHGDLVRAEFLRVQEALLELAPADPEFAGHTSRLGALASEIDVAWRVLVASPSASNLASRRLRCLVHNCGRRTCRRRGRSPDAPPSDRESPRRRS